VPFVWLRISDQRNQPGINKGTLVLFRACPPVHHTAK